MISKQLLTPYVPKLTTILELILPYHITRFSKQQGMRIHVCIYFMHKFVNYVHTSK